MTDHHDTPSPLFFLTVRGKPLAKTIEEARVLHNETAGSPQGVAAARALSDLSHLVHVPLDAKTECSDLLFLDIWSRIEGLNQFFSNPDVQKQGARLFKEKDATVWTPVPGVFGYTIPTPTAKTGRYVGIVRGKVKSRDAAREICNRLAGSINRARMKGILQHGMYYRLTMPNEPESLELLGLDLWNDAEGMTSYYQDGEDMKLFGDLFASAPETSVWKAAPGAWSEW
jgi:hypothetical protein